MLKSKESEYKTGRKKGDWWKYKLEPLTIDAVLLYAARGRGRRSNLYTDYTFGVWDNETLVTITKAYSGLTDKELQNMNSWILKITTDTFGPVRAVKLEKVFEVAFEGIAASTRHKSGIALRFPRILRIRDDKKAADADTLSNVQKLLDIYG